MYYRLKDNVALRKWKYVDRALYVKGVENAIGVSEEEFPLLLLCDGGHDLEKPPVLEQLLKEYIASGMQMVVDIWQFIMLYPSSGTYGIVPIACDKNEFNLRIPMCKHQMPFL